MAKGTKASSASDEPAAAPDPVDAGVVAGTGTAVTPPKGGANVAPDGFHTPTAMAALAHPERPTLDYDDPDD